MEEETKKNRKTEPITITIDKIDKKFCEENGYIPSRILRKRIQELRARQTDDVNFELANDRLRKQLEKISGKLLNVLTPEQYKEFFNE